MKWFAVSLSVILCHGFLVAQDRPNILMIAVDDLRPMLSCYGDERVQTPNFVLLLAECFSSVLTATTPSVVLRECL